MFLVDFCDAGTTNEWSRDNGVAFNCFINDIKTSRESQNLTFPVPANELGDVLDAFFLDPVNFFTYISSKRLKYNNDDQILEYISVGFTIDYSVIDFYPWSAVEDVYDWFMNFEKEQLALAPDGLSQGFMTENPAATMFINSWVAKLFTNSAITNVCLAGAAALIILTIATHNYIMALIAFACILLVVLCVLSVMIILGWKIGLIEAMCMSLIVGFSVDYVVHLAHAFVSLEGDDITRYQRSLHSLETMGVSVLAGFVTTFGASMFLLLCQLAFFAKFGVYICLTIIFSILVALFVFSSLALIVGPRGSQGDLRPLFKKICPCLCGGHDESAEGVKAKNGDEATENNDKPKPEEMGL